MIVTPQFVSNNIKFVWHSAPVQLAVLALELMAHYAASALESLVGLEGPKTPVTTPQDPDKKANHENPMEENTDKDRAEFKSYVVSYLCPKGGNLIGDKENLLSRAK